MIRTSLALALGILVSGPALAAHTYVCSVNVLSPGAAGWLGSEGAVTVSLHSGPRCTGTYQGMKAFCSADHTSSSCAAGVAHPPNTLLLSAQMLQGAMERGAPVTGQGRRCNGGARSTCWGNFQILPP